MVPTAFVVLDRLPLNRHGKLDRQALPDPQAHADAAQMSYEAPRNQIEQMVAAIWAEVLHVEKVGINANFFDLGGHSLLMVQVCDRVQAAFGRELSLVEMFRHPTVSALASYLGHEPISVPLQATDERAQRQVAARERQQQRMKKGREGG
jgi:acyl carrier protein